MQIKATLITAMLAFAMSGSAEPIPDPGESPSLQWALCHQSHLLTYSSVDTAEVLDARAPQASGFPTCPPNHHSKGATCGDNGRHACSCSNEDIVCISNPFTSSLLHVAPHMLMSLTHKARLQWPQLGGGRSLWKRAQMQDLFEWPSLLLRSLVERKWIGRFLANPCEKSRLSV